MVSALINSHVSNRDANTELPSAAHVIAVASGKGGAGKSFLALEIAAELAERGLVTVIADLDFGGSSLHHFLGFQSDRLFVQDYLQSRRLSLQKSVSLAECVHATKQQNLYFIPARPKSEMFGMTLPSAEQKIALLKALRSLKADFVILDLGAGTHLNVVDFAVFSDTVLLPVNAEEVSVNNAWALAAGIFSRKIETLLQLYSGSHAARSWNDCLRSSSALKRESSPVEFFIRWYRNEFANVAAGHDALLKLLINSIQKTHLAFVLNQARSEYDLESASLLARRAKEGLGFEAVFHGYIRFDDSVWQQIRKSSLPQRSAFSVAVQRDLKRVMNSLFDRIAALEIEKDSKCACGKLGAAQPLCTAPRHQLAANTFEKG